MTGANSSDTAFTDSMVPNTRPGGHRRANVRQFDIDDVAELLLGEVGDADRAGVAFDANPLVLFRVLEIGWVAHMGLGSGLKVLGSWGLGISYFLGRL